MSQLLIPRKFTQQPQGAVEIDAGWASIICFATNHAAIVDLKSGASPTVIGTINKVATASGVATLPASASSTRLSWSTTPLASMNNGYAMLIVAAPTASATLKRAFYIGAETAAAYTGSVLLFNSDRNGLASSGRVALIEYSSGSKAVCETDASAVDGAWHVYIVNRTAGTVVPEIYVDGAKRTTASSGATGVAFTSGVHLHGSPGSTTTGYDGPIVASAILNRALTTEEISDLSGNPWQIFKAPPHVLYFDVGAGPAPTFNPAWAVRKTRTIGAGAI